MDFMDSIHIQGGVALKGDVRIQGSKNAVLPILAATLLVGERTYLKNCPRIADVNAMLNLLRSLGCKVQWKTDGVTVDSGEVRCGEMPGEAVRGMRSSLFLLGALLGRCGEACMEYPGGCVIGERPIDMHLEALSRMGVTFEEKGGKLNAKTDRLHGAYIRLRFPSVGVTENVIMAGVMAEGDTHLEGAAREPEVQALCRFLCGCGAVIEGVGTDSLWIHGGRRLYGTSFSVPADRIVAGTYLFACLGCGGCVYLENAPTAEMEAVISLAETMGGRFFDDGQGLYVQAPQMLKPIRLVTGPYPDFPTDLQSVVLAVSTQAEGESYIEEHIFENRFRILGDLRKMGADAVQISPDCVRVHGRNLLRGCPVEAKELRGGAALAVAGMMAEGETVISGYPFIYRGYENICRDFRELGVRIASV